MRATWKTSIASGALFILVAGLVEAGKLPDWSLLVFIPIIFVGVLGIPQLREARAEAKKRGGIAFMQSKDFFSFFLPACGRMLVWFLSCAAIGLTATLLGLL